MKTPIIILISVLSVFSYVNAENIIKKGPFEGVDSDLLHKDFRAILLAANKDFILVEQGQEPFIAKSDPKKSSFNDGGTDVYKARGYTIIRRKTLSSFGGVRGLIYGPILTFDESKHWSGFKEISNLKFYTYKSFRALRDAKK